MTLGEAAIMFAEADLICRKYWQNPEGKRDAQWSIDCAAAQDKKAKARAEYERVRELCGMNA